MLPKKFIQEMQKGFKGEILYDEKTLDQNSRDASIFEVRPELVAFPKNERDVAHLVKFLNEKKVPGLTLTGRAAGTDMTGGPLTTSVVISFTKYMNKLKRLDKRRAIVQPGLYYRDFEKKMNKLGVMYPSYPASKSLCAMGGIVANNSGGEKTLTYGQTVDHVNKIRAVLADGKIHELKKLNKEELKEKMKQKDFEGELYRKMYNLCEKNYALIKKAQPKVSKNSSGYLLWKVWNRKEFDLSKVFVGSQGTLGIWLEAEVNVVKKNKHARLVTVYLDKLEQIGDLVKIVKPYNPESLESFDTNTLKLGLKFMPEIAKKVHKNLLSFLWDFRREGALTLLHGLPVFTVLVELTANKESEVKKQAKSLGAELTKKGMNNLVMGSEAEGEKYWIMRRESFKLLREKVKDKKATPFVDDFAVKPQHLAKFLPQLYKLLKRHGIQPTLAGHVGDGNFHIIPLMDLSQEEERKKIPIVLEKFVNLVNKYGGTITAEHNDGMIRTPFVEKQFGKKMVKLFEEVKDIFDPNGIFNPGKKVRGDLEFAMAHIKKT